MIIRIVSFSLLLATTVGFAPTSLQSKHSAIKTQQHLAKGNANNPKRQPQNKGFQQFGELDPTYCRISEEDIIILIRDRNKARRSRNFKKADEILATLNRNNVHLDDSKKRWRADGDIFDIKGYGSMEYTKASNSKPITPREEEYVVQKLRERSAAKLTRDFNTADDIIDELRFLKNVVVDDTALTWRVAEAFKNGYTYGGRRLNNIREEEVQNIESMIRQRADAKESKDYEKADSLLHQLKIDHGVRVDDASKSWYFLPKFDDESDDSDSQKSHHAGVERRFDISRNKLRQDRYISTNVQEDSDWSAIGHDVPDGISVHDKEVSIPDCINVSNDDARVMQDEISAELPGGISVVNDSGSAIPDGISIGDDSTSTSKASLTEAELAGYTVLMLKEKLRAAGLPVSGVKAKLIERLLESD